MAESNWTKACRVRWCPALVLSREARCPIHRHARTASDLKIAKDVEGHGGQRCILCKRQFTESDWVEVKIQKRGDRRKPGDAYGYRHVACDPPTPRLSRKAIRESDKPLLSDGELA